MGTLLAIGTAAGVPVHRLIAPVNVASVIQRFGVIDNRLYGRTNPLRNARPVRASPPAALATQAWLEQHEGIDPIGQCNKPRAATGPLDGWHSVLAVHTDFLVPWMRRCDPLGGGAVAGN